MARTKQEHLEAQRAAIVGKPAAVVLAKPKSFDLPLTSPVKTGGEPARCMLAVLEVVSRRGESAASKKQNILFQFKPVIARGSQAARALTEQNMKAPAETKIRKDEGFEKTEKNHRLKPSLFRCTGPLDCGKSRKNLRITFCIKFCFHETLYCATP